MKTLDFHSFMFFCCLCLEGWDKKERQRWGGAENDIEDLLNEEILGFQNFTAGNVFFQVIFFLLKKKLHGFQLLTSRKCIHSCFLFSMGFLEFVFRISFLVATVVAEACCVSFVSHRSPGSTAFAYSCQERLCTGKNQANSTC